MLHPLETDLATLWEFCRRVKILVREKSIPHSEKQIFARGLVTYATELATAVGWLTTKKIGPGAMSLMTTLEATQKTIEHVVNEMDDNDLRSVLRDPKGRIKVNVANWKNTTAKEFRQTVDSQLRNDCRHGGSIHWLWLREAEGRELDCEHPIKNQRIAVLGADAALVLILELFGEVAEEDQKWNYEQIAGNVWRDEDLDWHTSTNGQPWNAPYNQRQRPPKGMSQLSEAIDQYERSASLVFGKWGERRAEDTCEPWGEYRLYATKTAQALGESVYDLVAAGMYGAAFALARASWESAANAHYVWNEEPSQQVLTFLQWDDGHMDRSVPLPNSQAGWNHPIAKEWACLKEKHATAFAELAKGERAQGQRWAPKVDDPEHCPYTERELTNLVGSAAMNLMFVKASYFHFEEADSRQRFEKLMDRWKPVWPTFQPLASAKR